MSQGSPCIQVKPVGQPAVGLLWPPGYTASTNPIRVYDPHGVEVAAEGDTVTLSGGIINSPSSFCLTESYFEVSDVTKGAVENIPWPRGAQQPRRDRATANTIERRVNDR